MSIIWLISVLLKDMSIVDIFWGLLIAVIAWYFFLHASARQPRQFVIAYLPCIWGLRLAIHIALRNLGKGEDKRYTAWRKDWGRNTWWISYFRVFLLQGVLLYVISLPVMSVMGGAGSFLTAVNRWGILLWLFGWIFETVADSQLLRFRRNAENKGKIMDRGLWKYSRHPNYFGEACVWWGIFLISLGSGAWYISLLSPLLITFLLLRVSGVTLLEKHYAGNPAYAEYTKKTSVFFPLPPKKHVVQ